MQQNQNGSQENLKDRLLQGLPQIPANWALTPLGDNKAPYHQQWQHEETLARAAIEAEIKSGKAKGYGIRTGLVSNGILAVDMDGSSTSAKMLELSQGQELPKTIAFTSGRPGRCQYLYQVPEQYWDAVQTKKIKTGTNGDDGKPEQIELRWDGCQSVLPPSVHPLTGKYVWISESAPWECGVAEAPTWLIELMLREQRPPVEPQQNTYRSASRTPHPDSPKGSKHHLDPLGDIERALSYLDALSPSRADDYYEWLQVGMALHSVDDSLLAEWDRWSQGSPKYKSGDCERKWNSFKRDGISIGTLAYLAKQDGWSNPSKEGYSQAQSSRSHSFSDMLRWLKGLKQRVEKSRQSPWGFGKKDKVEFEPESTKSPSPSVIEYQPGERLEVWGQPNKFLWDSSGTGTGKSFDSGRVTPQELGTERIFYVTSDPRNPSTITLADWEYLDGRHIGLAEDQHGKLRRVKKGEPYSIAPNCGRVETITAIRDAGIQGADTSELICTTCPFYEACKGAYVYGYLKKRAVALNQKEPIERLISHPSSLPQPEATEEYEAFPYEKYSLIWDEWTTATKNTRQIKVGLNDLDRTIAHLATSREAQKGISTVDTFDGTSDIFTNLQPMLSDLRRLMTTEKAPGRFGWSHHALLDSLSPIMEAFDLDEIAEATQPNLEFLNTTGEHGVDAADLPSGVRKKFTAKDATTAEQARTTLLKQWIVPFLRIFMGQVGYLSLAHGTLTITIPDDRLIRIAHAAHRNIFLDATGHLEELALLLGISCSEITHVRQYEPPSDNLEYTQVAGMGRLGQQRGNEQQRRATAVVDALKAKSPVDTGVIRFKRYAEDGDYRHFIESRGVNNAENLNTLIVDGIPCDNLESLAAEFSCLYGHAPGSEVETIRYQVHLTNDLPAGIEPHFDMKVSADPGFREFVRRRTLANIQQTAGRLRANRRPNEKVQIFILGDFPLDVPVKLVKASDISLEAADTIERNLLGIFQGLMATAKAGVKQTQAAVADAAATTQGQVSKILTSVGGMDRVKKLFQMIIEPYSIWNNSELDQDEEFMAHEFLALVLEHEPENLVLEVANLARSCGLTRWKAMISSLDPSVHVAAVAQFVEILPNQWRRELLKLLPNQMQREIKAAT